MDEINIGILGHKLKSPLVTIKSLAFVLANQKDKNSKKVSNGLDEIGKKVDILNTRIDHLLEYLQYKNEQADFLYEIFDLSEIINLLKKSVKLNTVKGTIVADKQKLISALQILIRIFSIKKGSVQKEKNKIIFEFLTEPRLKEKNKHFEDSEINLFIAKKIIELQGGMVNEEKNNLKVTVPLKPARK
jgi:hypothetical protein